MPYAINPQDGSRIYYEVEGDGPPLIMHHGGGSSHARWRELGYVAALRDECQLILFDARGHGQSGKPTTPDAYRYERWVQDAVAVLDVLEIDRAHFFGYSLGGQIGFRVPLYAPDRFTTLILGGSHPYDHRDEWQSRYELFKDGGRLAIESAREAGRTVSDIELDALRSGAREAIALGLGEEPAVDAELASVAFPVLLFVGADDENAQCGRKLPEAARLIPGATLVMFSGLGHVEVLRRLDLVLPHLRAFIERVEATS
jgi:pimeloyl-ACP methyl ester carboxylesterase